MDVEPGGDGWSESLFFLALYASTELVGLLLRPVPNTANTFSRVGRLTVRKTDDGVWSTVKKITSLESVDFDPNLGYTIKVI